MLAATGFLMSRISPQKRRAGPFATRLSGCDAAVELNPVKRGWGFRVGAGVAASGRIDAAERRFAAALDSRRALSHLKASLGENIERRGAILC